MVFDNCDHIDVSAVFDASVNEAEAEASITQQFEKILNAHPTLSLEGVEFLEREALSDDQHRITMRCLVETLDI